MELLKLRLEGVNIFHGSLKTNSNLFRILIFLLILCGNFEINAQTLTVDKSGISYQIAQIFNFKSSIVSLTFDDGSPDQFSVAMPLLKERNLPATFYLISSIIDTTKKGTLLKNTSALFEIGSHTSTHTDLVNVGNFLANQELTNSKSALQKLFGDNAALTFAYPWGIYNSSIKQLVKNHYLAARSTDPGYNSLIYLDRYNLKVQAFLSNTSVINADEWIDCAIKHRSWLIEMIHGINNSGFSPIKSSFFSEHLDYIKAAESDIWCSTVSNVIKYFDESKVANIDCTLCNDTIYQIRVEDNLNDTIYNQPLSIKLKVPVSWESISTSNADNFTIEYSNGNKFVKFNTLPDNKLLTIKPGIISIPDDKPNGIRLVYLSANPFIDKISLSLEVLNKSNIDVILCDLNGNILINYEEKNTYGIINLFFDTSMISNGVYFLRVTNNTKDFLTKKLLKI